MKTINKIGIILLLVTILIGPFLFSVACVVGEANVFGVGGALRYSWLVYFGVPVAIISMVFALKAKNNGYHHRKNVIVSCLFIPVFLLIGSERYFFADFYDYTDQIIISVNRKTALFIPTNERVVTVKYGQFDLAIEKIASSKDVFESSMDTKWENSLASPIWNLLPLEASSQVSTFNKFLFYDCVSKDCNKVTVQDDGRSCVFLAYSTSSGRLMILDEYKYKA